MTVRATRDVVLVERDAQLAVLGEALDRAVGGAGSVVAVSGPAGIGKTSLIAAARLDAETRGLRVLHARGSQLERAFTFGVARSLLGRALRRCSDAERARLLAGAAAPAAVALGLETAPGVMVEASAALLQAIYWVIADLCDERPLVLVVDDAQWADGQSLRALAFLSNRIEALPLTLVLGVRDGEACDDAEALAALRATAVSVALDALSAEAVGELVAAYCKSPLDAAGIAALHRATGGNPLWSAQAAAILADRSSDSGIVGEQAWSTGALAAVVLARLQRMPDAAQATASAIAVLGDGAAPRHIGELAGISAEQVLVVADELAAAGLLDGGAGMSFTHPLMRDVVLSHDGEHSLALAHRRAAAMLRAAGAPAERIAGHVLRTIPDASTENVDDLIAAAADAMRCGSPATALAYARRAAEEPPPASLTGVVELMQGFAEFKLGRFADAAAHLAATASAADADVDVVMAHASALAYAGRNDDTYVRMLIDAVQRQSARDHQLLLTACAKMSSWYLVRRWVTPIELPPADSLVGRSSGECAALAAHAVLLSDSGDLNVAADLAERSLGDGRMLAERPSMVLVVVAPMWTLLWAGRIAAFDREAAHLERLARATAAGDATLLLNMLRIKRHWLCGDLPAALATFETMQRFSDGIPGTENHPIAHFAMATHLEVLLAHDGPEAADRELQAFTARTDVTMLPGLYSRWMHATRALVHLACGRAEQALHDAEKHATLLADHGGYALPVSWHTALPLARLATGDQAGALQAAEAFVEREETHAIPQRIATALRILARTAPERACALLKDAVALHAGGSMRVEHATAYVDLGVALRRDGRRIAARQALEHGADLATACQAHPLAGRAREELNILGAKPRRLAFSGVESLTASERRIADLAATGPTNREIAQQLFVSRKTVENHLANVFRKLDISSRDQLTEALTVPVAG